MRLADVFFICSCRRPLAKEKNNITKDKKIDKKRVNFLKNATKKY